MRAIRVNRFGGPDVLKLETDVPVPQLKDKQVLIQVYAAAVNPFDVQIRSGQFPRKKLPYTPGFDAAGIVEQIGPGVTKFKPGDKVYTLDKTTGSYAEHTAVDEHLTAHLPDSISFEEGAAIGTSYCTAYRAVVHRARAIAGETILIHGASGGVGIPCCQLSRALNLKVLGTAGTSEGLGLVQKNGACEVFNHSEEGYLPKIVAATGGHGPDIIIEMAAGKNLNNDLEIIKPLGGRIIIVGSTASIEISPECLMRKEITIKGVSLSSSNKDEWAEVESHLKAGMKEGWVKPVIGKTYPLEEANLAHVDIMKASGHYGKIILKI